MPAGGLPQQKRKSGVSEDPIEGVPPHDMRHLMGDHECDLVPLPLAHFQQRPTHENRPTWEGKRIRLPLRRDPDTERELLLLHVRGQPAPNLRRKSCGLILLDQGNSFQQSRLKVAAQTYLGVQGALLRSAHEVEGVLGLRDFLAKPVSNRFKQSFRHGTFPYWAAPAKLERPGIMLDLSIHLKSVAIIVAPYLTVEQAAFGDGFGSFTAHSTIVAASVVPGANSRRKLHTGPRLIFAARFHPPAHRRAAISHRESGWDPQFVQ